MSKKFLALAGIAVMVALTAVMAMPRGSEAHFWSPFFAPTDFYRVTPQTVSPAASPGAGTYPDIHAQYNVFEPSTNFTALFGGAMTLGGGQDPTNDVLNASAAGIPNTGALVGSLTAGSILGLAGEGCNSLVPVTFRFAESNTDNTLALPMGSATPAGPSTITLAAAVNNSTQVIPYVGADLLGTKSGVTEGTAGDPNHPDAAVNEIRIDGEDMLVTGVDEAANNFIVIRGWNSAAAPIAHPTAGVGIDRVNVIYPNGPPANLLANLAEDDGNIDNAGGVEHPFLVNNVSDGADEVPSFVRNSQDPNGNADDGGAIQSYARYAGNAFVANSLIVILQFSVLAPGVLPANGVPNLQWVTSDWGYQSVTYLNDPLAPPSNSAITDFCNFSSNTFFYGTPHDNECTAAAEPAACNVPGGGFVLQDLQEPTGSVCQDGTPTTPNECGTSCAPACAAPCDSGNCWRARNPTSPSLVRYYQYGVSQRDYDNDGVENALDTCASDPNPGWNPRANNITSGGDTDGDGLPDACDPAPAVFLNDQDGDTWLNRLDNCPVNANTVAPAGGGGSVRNTYQFDGDTPLGANVPDGGPANDNIGPGSANPGDSGCDVAANNCADPFPACGPLSPNGANGHYHATAAAQTICIGAVADATPCSDVTDDDSDGVPNSHDTCIRGPNAPAPMQGPSAQDTLTAVAPVGQNFVDVGSTAGFINGQAIIIDTGANRETLRYITGLTATRITFADFAGPPPFDQSLTNPTGHAVGSNVAMVAFSQSLRDFNNDGFADGTDITILSGSFGKLGGDPTRPAGYQGRLDLNNTGLGPDSVNDGTDITLESGSFGKKCGPTPSGGF